ncbi:hypothetical protein [Ectobacillus polymachus]|uniref:hypothetical protein n=1 Tax=Ectobacillus polymachus TaxID=1508806 RepID=UPI003A83D272
MSKDRKTGILFLSLSTVCFAGSYALKTIFLYAPTFGFLLGTLSLVTASYWIGKTEK